MRSCSVASVGGAAGSPAIATTHAGERVKRPRTRDERVAAMTASGAAGSRVNTDELGYDIQGNRVGMVASGADAMEAIEAVATELNRRSVRVPRSDRVVWAWLSGGPVAHGDFPDLGVSPA